MSKVRERIRSTTIGRSARVISRKDQRKIILVTILQVAMGALDLVGVAIIGVLGALAVSGVQSRQPGGRVTFVLSTLGIDNLSFQNQAAVLGAAATIILISRTVFSVIFTRRTMYFLSRRGAAISTHLVSKLLSQSLLKIQERSTQETIYSVTTGVNLITLGILGTTVGLISDTSLLLVMGAGLFVFDPLIAVSTTVVFGLISLVMYKLMHKRAQRLGALEAELSILSNEKISEVLNSYRESVVRNRRDYYAREIGALRLDLANTLAEIAFMPNISKYVIETTMVLGALAISAVQFVLQDATHAVATLSVFLAAGTRIAPAILRVQQGSIVIKGSLGSAGPTLDLIESLGELKPPPLVGDFVDTRHNGFRSIVEMKNVTLVYPGKMDPAISDINLRIDEGKSVAIVGTSGAGKTSLVDVLLGVLTSQTGDVEISGLSPLQTVEKWPGAISYVPQDVMISNGTIRQNVALGYPISCASDELVWKAIETAQLTEFVQSLPNQLETQVGERGTKISGGQRQRLGIARAMFTQPKLLVLDEATSSLDGQTEFDISEAIQGLKGSVTVVMVAHRLSTVRNADVVVYLNQGRISAVGSFDEVRQAVPDFDKQAALMGL
jgi:ABC-type multidrug transport system fused ATPase/permease subunit